MKQDELIELNKIVRKSTKLLNKTEIFKVGLNNKKFYSGVNQ